MDDNDTSIIANRDEAIPILRIPSRDDDGPPTPSSSSEAEQKVRNRDKFKDGMGRLKETLDTQYSGPGVQQRLGDKLFANMLSFVVPRDATLADDDDDSTAKKDRRSRKYVERPNFSLPQMTTNFRRFNARIGIIFVLQNRLIHLFTWRQPTATLSFLAIWSVLSLNPHLVPMIPLIGLLFYVMIPSFIARHPVSANDPRIEPSFRGPAVAPPSRVKPAPDLSKDFMRNMRDLQNCMEDFSTVHDAANEYLTPYTNFSDEMVSSAVFVAVFGVACTAVIGSRVVPWRFIMLAAGWVMTLSGHPNAQNILLSSRNLKQVRAVINDAQGLLRSWIDADIILDEPPEVRQVEIFELQKYHIYSDTWESWLFSATPYDPLSPLRIAAARAKGTQFFEDVQPPNGWGWKDKKWTLDLASREWVEQRMITGVEVETEGERWVYDLPDEVVDVMGSSPTKRGKKGKVGKSPVVVPKSGWEEGNGFGERGAWRRRRWVRVVGRRVPGGGASVKLDP
ncbi:Peroxisome size and maintenance regulator [Vermiconidia calcicola]|uniref:Peroxisome size and maintenance regulator n=1 Tax=Vermiconidia calcicola TaxID=1690605 RepID=A0ACC3NH39_9PEZI|nr:Peroxisome size and maintenance regulator [Vermiconidia calcicola]